jgi:anti-sigma B factor antagonist
MPDAGFPIGVINGVPVITTPGEIDIANADALRSALLEATTNWRCTLLVDMTRTQFCDVSGLHALVAAHKHASANGHEVLLVISSAAILRVLALTGMDGLIPNFTSLAEALGRTDRDDDQPRYLREPTAQPSAPEATTVGAPAPSGD